MCIVHASRSPPSPRGVWGLVASCAAERARAFPCRWGVAAAALRLPTARDRTPHGYRGGSLLPRVRDAVSRRQAGVVGALGPPWQGSGRRGWTEGQGDPGRLPRGAPPSLATPGRWQPEPLAGSARLKLEHSRAGRPRGRGIRDRGIGRCGRLTGPPGTAPSLALTPGVIALP